MTLNSRALTTICTFILAIMVSGTGNLRGQGCNYNFDLGADVNHCGESYTLSAPAGFDTYVWGDGSSGQNFTATSSGLYSCQIAVLENSVVANGDFSLGDVDFDTDYIYGTGGAWGLLSNEGQYAVVANPADAHSNFAFCYDHTVGDPTGSMMVVNGASTPGTIVWEQTIAVEPGTDYAFSFWGMSAVGDDPAILNFIIDGVIVGTNFQLDWITCNWENFQVTWNSGTLSSVTIAIGNENSNPSGNDFAIDDISFAKACVYVDEVQVTLETEPEITLPADYAICAGETVNITATVDVPEATFHWSPGNSTSATISVTPASTTTYTVTAETPGGCESEPASVTVFVSTPNAYNLDVPASFISCSGEPVQFTIPTTSTGEFQWSPAIYLDNPTLAQPTATVSETTDFTVTYTNSCGATQTAVTTLFVMENVLNLGDDFSICEGETFHISLPAGASYLWQDGTVSSQYTISEGGIYQVIASFENCSVSDFLIVNEVPAPSANLSGPESICAGTTATLTTTGEPGMMYEWNNGSTDSSLDITTGGSYFVSVFDPGTGCSSTEFIEVVGLPQTRLAAPDSAELCAGSTVRITAATDPGMTIVWAGKSPSPVAEFTQSGTYMVTASGPCGTLSEEVVVYDAWCDEFVYVPNSFSPDGNGINDVFKAVGNRIKRFEMWIFDRWGREVFYSNDIDQGWNGAHGVGGAYYVDPQPLVYRISVEYESKNVQDLYGTITVIR